MASGLATLAEIDKRLDEDPLLTDAERVQIKEKAREHVRKKRKDKAEAELLAKEIRAVEIEQNPLEQYEDVTVDLAPYVASAKLKASCITLDARMYFHGVTYSVPYSVARTLEDIMARTWEHENEIHGRPRRADMEGIHRPSMVKLRPGAEGAAIGRVTSHSSLTGAESI
jgi:hypothetical protein